MNHRSSFSTLITRSASLVRVLASRAVPPPPRLLRRKTGRRGFLMATRRRWALAAVLALLALTLLPTAGQAQTETPLVSNTGQSRSTTSTLLVGDRDKTSSQGFTTGTASGGYALGSVGVYVANEDLETGETFTVHIYTATATGARDSLVYTLTSPDSYTDNAVNVFTAPPHARLAASTDYLVVLEATGDEGGDFTLGLTDSDDEDSSSATGWSIEDARRVNGSFVSSGTALMISVVPRPVAPLEVAVVPLDWPLIPSGVSPGQQFRLIFLTSTSRDASSTDINVYNEFIQNRADAGHEAIRGYSSGFRVVGSTATVDARDNTATNGTGVRIYWLNGVRVADNYTDFYDGTWDDEAAPRDESGNLHSLAGQEIFPATGSRHNGRRDIVPEMIIPAMDDVPEMTIPEQQFTLGANAVRVGALDAFGAANGPLESTSNDSKNSSATFYGLSQIFQVDAPQVEEESLLFNVDELPEPVDPPPLVVVPPGWELIPDGLGTGSQFRLLFVTSGLYSADSSDIADYNRKVRFNAWWGHAALAAYAGGFRVVGSTASVHVVANTGTVFSDANPGVPIYWVKGEKAADDYADFYNRSWDEEREGRSARGEALSRFSRRSLATSGVWTGIGAGHELGTAEVVMGLPNKNPFYYKDIDITLTGPLNSDFLGDGEPDSQGGGLDFAPLYGLSQVFQVGGPTTTGPAVPTKPRNLRMETCHVHSYQVTNDNDTPDDDTDDTTETRRRGIPLLLTWDPPASDADESDGIPSSYFNSPYVEVSEDGGGAWEPADGSNAFTTQLSYRLGYYPVGETVQFRVWAKNANGGGPPSEPVSVTIPRCGGGEADPILTITAVRSTVPFLNYEEAGVLPALVDFQVSRTGLWLNAMRFETTFAQADSLGLPPGHREWNFPAGNRIRHIQQVLPYNEHWGEKRDCAALDCTRPTAVTYQLEECPECGYTLGDPSEATVNVISAELGLGGDEEEEEETTQPLTARFKGLPEGGHGGAGETFTLRLEFSEPVSATPEAIAGALQVTNATVEAVSRLNDRSDLWEIGLTPDSDAEVLVLLGLSFDCGAMGAVCTLDGKTLSYSKGTIIMGPSPVAAEANTEPAPARTYAVEDDVRVPRNLSAQAEAGGVALRWLPPAEGAASVDGYEILRRRPTNPEEPALTTLVDDTSNADTTYFDATATEPGVRYTYRVKAIRSGARSDWSNIAMVLRPPSAPPPPAPLVSNLGQSASATALITQQYAQGFRLGTHGQGYAISSVSIDLVEALPNLTVSLWIDATPGYTYGGVPQNKLFDFENPPSFEVGLNKFTAPAGAFAYPNVNYYIVLSGSSVSIKETTSNEEDAGGETGAVLLDVAMTRPSTSTGRWSSSNQRGSVLRLAVEGSKRDRGILASTYAQPADGGQEIISIGDHGGIEITLPEADRYIIHGLSLVGDNTTRDKNPFQNPFVLHDGPWSPLGPERFSLPMTRFGTGINVWTAPQGATVAGGCPTVTETETVTDEDGNETEVETEVVRCKSYIFDYDIVTRLGHADDDTSEGRLFRWFATLSGSEDTPTAPGVTLRDGTLGEIALGTPLMAVLGEPLHAMVQNLGQADSGYVSLGAEDRNVLAQAFTTGPSSYRFKGIGINIEGSDDTNGNAQVPSGPDTVSVAVYIYEGGSTAVKLFDLVSPGEFIPGHSFFEAPPGAVLLPNTTYLVEWSYVKGSWHRLQRTSSNDEDSGAQQGFKIHNTLLVGDSGSASEHSDRDALEMAVYGEPVSESTLMVSNLGQDDNGYVSLGDTDSKVLTQAFRTGAGTYRFKGIGINIEGSDDSSGVAQVPQGMSPVSVVVRRGDIQFDLIGPEDFDAGFTFFQAPQSALLEPNTTYLLEWHYLRSTWHRLQKTSSEDEDSGSLQGFTISGPFSLGASLDSRVEDADGNALEMAVYGVPAAGAPPTLDGSYQVGINWFHIPDGLLAGDQFRLVFVTQDQTDATSGDIEDYNEVVQEEAAKEYNHRIIRGAAPEFKAVVCTADVDARTYTEIPEALDVPIYWLDGGWDDRPRLIANSHYDFYDGVWIYHGDEEETFSTEWGAIAPGNSTYFYLRRVIWTGCRANGVAHPEFHMGIPDMEMVAVGTPGDPRQNFGPLGTSGTTIALTADIDDRYRLYAISPVFTVVAFPGSASTE